jgi:hypothetical protein
MESAVAPCIKRLSRRPPHLTAIRFDGRPPGAPIYRALGVNVAYIGEPSLRRRQPELVGEPLVEVGAGVAAVGDLEELGHPQRRPRLPMRPGGTVTGLWCGVPAGMSKRSPAT